jgi:hypothetical protein
MLLLEPVNTGDVVMVVGEELPVGEAIASVGAKVDGVMDVCATNEGARVVGATDDGAAVDGTKVDGMMDVGEGLEMVDVDAGFVTGLNVGDVVDGLLTFPPVFVQNVDVLVGS